MKRLALWPLVWGLAACATPGWRGALEAAADRGAVEQAELLLVAGGDAAAAADKAEEVLARGTEAARAFFALVVASDALGDFERPLPYLARALDQAAVDVSERGNPWIAARLAAEAGRAWARLDGRDARSEEIAAALRRLADRPGPAWEEARARALRELVQAERLAHGVHAARLAAERAGFVLRWRLSAPWGEAPMLDFLAPLGPETRPLAASETTGAGWDLLPVPTTDETFSDGEVTFFDLPATGGVGFAEAELAEGPARRLRVRLESNRLCEVRVDGVPVVTRADVFSGWLHVADVALPAGPHRLTVKLASADGRGFFRVQLSELPGGATATAITVSAPPAGPTIASRPRVGDARGVVQALLEIEDLVSRPRWDPESARARLEDLERATGSLESVSIDLLAARLALGDTAAPPAERRQTARARYESVLAVAPHQPVARRGLARIEREEERPDRALALLRGDGPGVPVDRRTALELLDLYRDRGWEVEALALVASLGPTAAASPRLLQEMVDTYEAFGRRREAEDASRLLEERFPGSGVERLHALAADRGEVDPDRPRALYVDEPQRHALLRAAVADLRRLGRLDEAAELVEGFRRMRPRDGWALAERVKIALQRGDRAVAIARADEALALAPDFAPMEELRALLLERPEPYDAIEDGRQVVARWRELAGQPAAAAFASYPIVVLLDRSAVSVRADGSTIELEHRVRLVQTKQGADELGDARPPDGARLLVARTLKADGRVLEPERTEGKPDLSFPELQPGDVVETAWVTRSRVAPSEGGYLTGFAFASWGAPIVSLEAEVVAAPGLALELTRFGGAPEPVRADGPNGASLRWALAMLPPVQREPLGLSPRSFFPFADVRVARAATPEGERDRLAWRAIGRSYAARIAALGVIGPRTGALAARLSKVKRPIAAAFEWVKTEVSDIEQLNAFETPVEAAVGNEKGNRALVLATVLRAMGVSAELLLCAPERDGPPEDRARPTPNPNRFFYPIVMTADGPLDPARPYTPAGDVPAELVGAACLAPDADGGRVRTLERPGPAAPTFESTLTLTLDPSGDARGTLVGLARGAGASPLRQAFLAQDEERQRIIFEQWIASLAVGARLVDYAVEDAADGEAPMRWRLSIELPGWAQPDGDALVVQRPLKPLLHADFAGVTDLAQLVARPERTTPLRVLPFTERVVLELRAPGRALVAAPPEVSFDPHRGGLSQMSEVSDDRVVITRAVAFAPGRVAPAEYGAFRAAAGQAIRAFESALRFAPR